MISMDKKYRTRDGREVCIYSTDTGLLQPAHGAYKSPDCVWFQHTWNLDGTDYSSRRELDLIEIKPRHKQTVWLNVYGKDMVDAFASREHSDSYHLPRIACIKVELVFEEGEGL